MKHIASCSFGKDSIAAIMTRLENNEPIDEIVYCRIMYDDNISAEYPEHEDFIFNKAIPFFEKEYGLKTTVVQSGFTYKEHFYRKKKRGWCAGKIYGFPYRKGAWCNSGLKTSPIDKHLRHIGEHKDILGIAYDEPKRIKRALDKGKVLPLVEHKITEAEAFKICEKYDLLSPAYDEITRRLGCWFCHNQRIADLKKLRSKYPELWRELLKLDKDSPVSFKPREQTVEYFEERFSREDRQISFF